LFHSLEKISLAYFLLATRLLALGCAVAPMSQASSGQEVGFEQIAISSALSPPTESKVARRQRDLSLTPPSYFDSQPTSAFRLQSPDDALSAQVYLDDSIYESDAQASTDRVARPFRNSIRAYSSELKSDLRNFYAKDNLPLVLGALGVGAILANGDMDQSILEQIQDNITFHQSDEFQEFVTEYRFFGEGNFLLPVYVGTALLGKHVFEDYPAAATIGDWGDRCFRGILLGTPPLLISQYVLGSSRPGETSEGSEWQFLQDNNGVSGHAFMGAIPFLTASKMAKTPRGKVVYFVLSTLPALSRVSENGHYPSQALLGWGLAYLSVRSVSRTEEVDFQLSPIFTSDSVGLGFTLRR
jgi:hypothetical protein